MTVDAVFARIQEIQSQIATLRGGVDASATATSSTDASTAFADALSAASDPTTATGASATAAPATTDAAAPTSTDAEAGALATGSGATGTEVVADAEKYLGVPYVFGGTTRSGMDCSGLVQTVFKDLGVHMPRVVPDQAKMGVAVPSLAQAQPGDLIIPKGEGHVVIYVGNGKVLHAPHPGKDVRIVDNWLKDSDIATIRRIVPSTATSSPPAAAASDASAVASARSLLASLSSATGAGSSASSLDALASLGGLSSLSSLGGLSSLSSLGGTVGTSSADLQTAALMSLLGGGSIA
ncbi:NlpC/P60 family protein [Curtobacterium sp. MCBD17_013]|uniref:C40 family peptidase n=1 Tax=Curtobacterium sp. MCBD17_013 TaxID=2175668 RepID=UPI000DAAC47B|nr:C40 family peptidase [Curtobacterium sp. MCBD17_013]PZF66431.1 NlpC/P60 family protein [Curtobacterium sp. MCBD17_013]